MLYQTFAITHFWWPHGCQLLSQFTNFRCGFLYTKWTTNTYVTPFQRWSNRNRTRVLVLVLEYEYFLSTRTHTRVRRKVIVLVLEYITKVIVLTITSHDYIFFI